MGITEVEQEAHGGAASAVQDAAKAQMRICESRSIFWSIAEQKTGKTEKRVRTRPRRKQRRMEEEKEGGRISGGEEGGERYLSLCGGSLAAQEFSLGIKKIFFERRASRTSAGSGLVRVGAKPRMVAGRSSPESPGSDWRPR